MFEHILEKIKEFDTIIIHRHIRPDGDCIGSQFGLKRYLEYNFPNKKIYAVGDEVPEYLSQLGTSDKILPDIYNDALVIVVDTSLEKRICDSNYKLGKYIIKIDHHDDSPMYGDYEYVDPLSPACCAILVKMFREYESVGYTIPLNSAIALYTGIITDTGRFRFRGVTGETMANAGYLLDKGINTDEVFTKLYIKSVEELKLEGYVYNHFKTTKNGVAYIYFTKDIIEKYNVTKEEAANLVNCLDSINGSLIWVAFVDQMLPKSEIVINENELPENEIRVRIRSRFVSINAIATHYRGGGHLQAAGATIYSKKEMNNLLKELDEALYTYKNEHPEAF